MNQKSIYLNLANEYRRRRNPSRTFRSLGACCNSRGRHLLQTAAEPQQQQHQQEPKQRAALAAIRRAFTAATSATAP